MENEKIIINENMFGHKFLSHVDNSEKERLFKMLSLNKAFLVSFYSNNKLKFISILELKNDNVRLAEIGGNFQKSIGRIQTIMIELAKKYRLEKLSLRTEKRAIKRLALRMNFEELKNNEFIKVL